MPDYEDSYDREEKDLNLHIAKMLEHMEFEATLPDQEKHKRRLIRYIQSIPQAAKTAAETNLPWILFGAIERVVYHAEQLLGPNWREDVSRERHEWFEEGDEDELLPESGDQ